MEKVIRWTKLGRPPGGSKGAALQLASGSVTCIRSAGSQTRSIVARALVAAEVFAFFRLALGTFF